MDPRSRVEIIINDLRETERDVTGVDLEDIKGSCFKPGDSVHIDSCGKVRKRNETPRFRIKITKRVKVYVSQDDPVEWFELTIGGSGNVEKGDYYSVSMTGDMTETVLKRDELVLLERLFERTWRNF